MSYSEMIIIKRLREQVRELTERAVKAEADAQELREQVEQLQAEAQCCQRCGLKHCECCEP